MRLYTLVVSMIAHAAILLVLVVVPLLAMDALPQARTITEFIRADAAELPDPPPPPAKRTPHAPADAPQTGAPVHAPDRIEPELPRPSPVRGVPVDGAIGVPDGVDGALPLPGPPPSVPEPPKPPAPVRAGGDIRPPTKIKEVAPVYPEIARAARVQGTVILEAVIGEDGRIRDVRVLRSIPLLDGAAIDAVRQWRFTPTRLNGEPVPVVMTVTVAFKLS
jgi:periplasmic protein TonB